MKMPKGTRILIVEDSSVMRTHLKNLLHTMGFDNITEARTGLDGITKLVQQRSINKPIQFVISDWEMPELTGLEFLKMIRAVTEWEKLPVIFLTSFSSVEDVVVAAAAGVENYLVKPATLEGLTDKLEAAYIKNAKQMENKTEKKAGSF